jgi:hypothetical protein
MNFFCGASGEALIGRTRHRELSCLVGLMTLQYSKSFRDGGGKLVGDEPWPSVKAAGAPGKYGLAA